MQQLLEFVCNSELSISQITHEEFCQVIEIGSSNLKSCIDKMVSEIELEDSLAQITDDDYKMYLLKEIDQKNFEDY